MWYNMPINAEIIKFLQSFHSPFMDSMAQYVTMLGEETFFMVLVVIIYWCINKNFGYRIGFAYLSNSVINSGIKCGLKIPRPIGEEGIRSLRLETAGGYSFPSGHSQCASSLFSSLMIQLKKKWFYILGIIMILMVMTSRLYLGVHRPIDVLAGAIIGFLWVLVCNWMFDRAERTGNKAIFLIFIIPMLVLLFVLPAFGIYNTDETYRATVNDFFKGSGTVLAFYIGYIIEPKYIKYEVKGEAWKQGVKIVVGLAVMVAIKTFVKPILPASPVSDFFRYLLMGAWVTMGAPYLFKKLLGTPPKSIKEDIPA